MIVVNLAADDGENVDDDTEDRWINGCRGQIAFMSLNRTKYEEFQTKLRGKNGE